jgi:hypothetical protein
MTTVQYVSPLANLSIDRLRQVMFDRLHGLQSVGPALDARFGPESFSWLSDEFRRGDSGLRDRMSEVLRCFLNVVTDVEQWPAPARTNLLDLIQDCGEEVVDDLRQLVRTRVLLDLPAAGPPAHAGLLKCLLSLRHYDTPQFWSEQFRVLGPESGALIFSGLVEHGLEIAARHLPELSAHDMACRFIQLGIPVLQDRFGTAAVARAFQQQMPRLTESARERFNASLELSPTAEADVLMSGTADAETPVLQDADLSDEDELDRISVRSQPNHF